MKTITIEHYIYECKSPIPDEYYYVRFSRFKTHKGHF